MIHRLCFELNICTLYRYKRKTYRGYPGRKVIIQETLQYLNSTFQWLFTALLNLDGVNYSLPSVKQVTFYDDDVCFWQHWRNRTAAAEAPIAANQHSSAFITPPPPSTRGRHFLVICCENKAIFLDLVTMRGRDVPKQELDNKSLLWYTIFFLLFLLYI